MAYIWAVRIPNTPAPSIRIGSASYIPTGEKTPVAVTIPNPQWKYLQRARGWTLQDAKSRKFPIPILKLANQKAVEADWKKGSVPPGDYHLGGYWDWIAFQATGEIHAQPLSTFDGVHLEAASQNSLLARAGKIPVTLDGGDFEFLTKVELKKVNDEFPVAEPLRFLLPKGLRQGPQTRADVQVDTGPLDFGQYEMLLSQGETRRPNP